MFIEIEILTAPGRGSNAYKRFYAGVRGDSVAGVLWGPASPGAEGRWKAAADASEVVEQLCRKKRKDYAAASWRDIPQPARQYLCERIVAALPHLQGREAHFDADRLGNASGIRFTDAATAPRPAQRPKRRARLVHTWF